MAVVSAGDAVKYAFRSGGVRNGVTAQAAGEELAKIQASHGGKLSRADIVRSAKNRKSPIHACFTWDDTEAARLRRLDEAGDLVRSIQIVFVEQETGAAKKLPAYVSVQVIEEEETSTPASRSYTQRRVYHDVQSAMSDADIRKAVLADALAQLRGLQRRFGQLQELGAVFAALDAVE